jgi:hypothetical protein
MRAQPINLTRINIERPTVAMHQPKRRAVAAMFAAAVAATFVAGRTELDASSLSNGAVISSVSASLPAAKSETPAITFPEANHPAKGDRLGVYIPDNEIGAGQPRHQERGQRVRAKPYIPGGEREPIKHCERVGSPLASPTVLYLPLRSCIARVEPLSQYTVLGAVAHAS